MKTPPPLPEAVPPHNATSGRDSHERKTGEGRITRRWLLPLLAVATGTCLGVGGAELVVRIWEQFADTSEEFTLHGSQQFKNLHRRSDCPGLPYELRPGATAVVNYGRGRRVNYRINSRGMRGPDPVEATGVRVLLLGDSVTFGYYAQEESTFASLLSENLRHQCPVQVFNGGVGGYNTYTELEWYKCRGRPMSPHVVLLCFCPNDVDDPQGHFSWHTLEAIGRLPDPMCPNPRLSRKLREAAARKARSRCWATWQDLRKSSRLLWRASLFWDRQFGPGRRPFSHCLTALADPHSPETVWLRSTMARLQAEVVPEARLLTAIFPVSYQVQSARHDESLREVARMAQRLGLPVVNLLPHFREDAGPSFLDASHLSPAGHRTAARVLSEFLREPIRAVGAEALDDPA